MQPYLRVCWLSSSLDRALLAAYVDSITGSGLTQTAAAFELVEGGAQQRSIVQSMRRMGRAMDAGDAYRTLPDSLVIAELNTLDSALALEAHLGARASDAPVVVSGIYRELVVVEGTADPLDDGFAPAIQLGVFDMRSADDERAMSEWYRDRRLPAFCALPGAIRARRLVSVCGGPAKFGIFYEFRSLSDRMEHFEPMNALDHEVEPEAAPGPGGRPRLIADRTVHPPMSPSIGSLMRL